MLSYKIVNVNMFISLSPWHSSFVGVVCLMSWEYIILIIRAVNIYKELVLLHSISVFLLSFDLEKITLVFRFYT